MSIKDECHDKSEGPYNIPIQIEALTQSLEHLPLI